MPHFWPIACQHKFAQGFLEKIFSFSSGKGVTENCLCLELRLLPGTEYNCVVLGTAAPTVGPGEEK